MIKKRRRIIIAIIVFVVLLLGIYQIFFRKEKSAFTLDEVVRGSIAREISETGQVKKGEEINLGFQSSGRIEEIYVDVGDKVKSGQVLARIDTDQLEIQLGSARQKLEDAIDTTNEKIEKSYKDALSDLDDAYLRIYDVSTFLNLLKITYFGRGDVDSINIAENVEIIKEELNRVKSYIDAEKSSQDKKDIDTALSGTEKALSRIGIELESARNTMEVGNYRDIVSSANKTTLDTHKLNINTCYSNIVSSQTNISLAKVTATAEINAAQSQVSDFENQLQEAVLISPTDGEIIKVNKRKGETSQSALAESMITLLPLNFFQIDVDIYEGDIVEVKVGNPVEIDLVAFPDRTFMGKVLTIDPAEKLSEGVVYYKVTIIFEEETPEGIKSGMTADVRIKTSVKENVLTIPQGAVQTKDGKNIVQVYKNKKTQDREVVTGVEGSDGRVEVVSGLEEGEKVIVK